MAAALRVDGLCTVTSCCTSAHATRVDDRSEREHPMAKATRYVLAACKWHSRLRPHTVSESPAPTAPSSNSLVAVLHSSPCHVTQTPCSRVARQCLTTHLRQSILIHKPLITLPAHPHFALPRKHLDLLLRARHTSAPMPSHTHGMRRSVASGHRSKLARRHFDMRRYLAISEQLGADLVVWMLFDGFGGCRGDCGC